MPEILAPDWAQAAHATQRRITIEARATAKGRYFTGLSFYFSPDGSSR
ncbi:MAG: hypothetical protein WAN13_15835 [Candidatus Acidiferrales bacterium]